MYVSGLHSQDSRQACQFRWRSIHSRYGTQADRYFGPDAPSGEEWRKAVPMVALRGQALKSARDARRAFSEDNVTSISAHPTRAGCGQDRLRYKTGCVIIMGSLFWRPIGASLARVRRKEILGIEVQDVMFGHDVPFIHFGKNKNRRLRNAASERRVPIHNKLLELGFKTMSLTF